MIARFKNKSYQWSPLAVFLIILLACVSLPDAKHTKASLTTTAKPSPAGDVQESGPVIRELKLEYEGGLSMSRDGRKLVYGKWKKGHVNLVVRNLLSGEETEITDYTTGHTQWPVFSPDGKEIAYTHYKFREPLRLHIVSLRLGEDRPLDHKGMSLDWSRDGRLLLVLEWPNNVETYSILSINGQAAQKVDLSLSDGADAWRFSPDAKYVSCSREGNLYLYRLDGRDAIQITRQSKDDTQPIWSPNGKMLVFLSRRSFGPEPDLCVLPVVDGKAAGKVRIIRPDFGDDVKLISISETGRLLCLRSLTDQRIFSATIDPKTGQPTGEPLELALGSHPVWSPDGKRIAYIAKGVLRVMSADGSNDQQILAVGFRGADTYAWAPDNEHIYIQEFRESKRGIYAISISTKERQPVFFDPNTTTPFKVERCNNV